MTDGKITKAVLLAAGLGTRLRPLTFDLPKPLLPLNGWTSLDYTLHFLKRGGIDEVVINIHHLGSKIKSHVGNGTRYGLVIHYSEESDILGTGGGVKQAVSLIGGGPCVVLNSVVVIDCDLKKIIRAHQQERADATMVLRSLAKTDQFTPVAIDAQGHIVGFGKEGDHFYTGLQVIGPKLLSLLPAAGKPSCMIQDGYLPLIAAGGRVCSAIHCGYWNKVETHERYEEIKKDVAAGYVRLTTQDANGGQ